MQVWTCKQNTRAFCTEEKYIHNTRDLSDNGMLTPAKRLPCPYHWQNCPLCYSFLPDGSLIHHTGKE